MTLRRSTTMLVAALLAACGSDGGASQSATSTGGAGTGGLGLASSVGGGAEPNTGVGGNPDAAGGAGVGGGAEAMGGTPNQASGGAGGSASTQSTGGWSSLGGAGVGGLAGPLGGTNASGGAGSGAGGIAGDSGTNLGGVAGTVGGEGGSAMAGAAGEAAAGGASGGTSNTCPSGVPQLASASLPAGFCAWTWASEINSARGMLVDGAGDVLVVERGGARVLLLADDDGDGIADDGVTLPVAEAPELNHGIAISNGMLYASSATTVYRWAYTAGVRAELGAPEVVITGMPDGGHSTRTLAFDSSGTLYVSVGSGSNLDSDSARARIISFSESQLSAGSSFDQGEVFADGLRNEVGLRFDDQGRLWGVENGIDNLNRSDLGGDIHNDNPAEELNLFGSPGRFYGYPYCWSEYLLPQGVGEGPNTQWAHPDFISDGQHDDAWCKDTNNVVPPALSLQAHTAPLDLIFYNGTAFPSEYRGDAFVGMHGSWNRVPEIGYKVVRVPLGSDGMPIGNAEAFLEYAGDGDTGPQWPHRPVGLAVLPNGVMLVTSDSSNQVIAVGYAGG